MKTKTEWAIFFVLLGAIMMWIGYTDRQDQIAEAQHTADLIARAKQEAVDDYRKSLFDAQYEQAEAQLNLKDIKHHDH